MLTELGKCYPADEALQTFTAVIAIIATITSYIPQLHRIISNKTSQGFSPWFFLFGVVSLSSRLFNLILLQWGTPKSEQCFDGLIEISLAGTTWLMFCSMFYLFLHYFPEHMKETQRSTLRLSNQMMVSKEWRDSLWITRVCIAHFVISYVFTMVFLMFAGNIQDNQYAHYWSSFLIGLTMISDSLQYLPQIWKTWRLKTVGALSIFTLILQSPGPILFLYPYIAKPGTSLAQIVTSMIQGSLQTILLIMCVVWHYRNKRLGVDDLDIPKDDLSVPDERSRLLM